MNIELVKKLCLGILNKAKPFYNNISLKRIREVLLYNFEKGLVDIMCYLSLIQISNKK